MKENITAELSNALKNGDKERIHTLRLIIAAIKDKEIAQALELPPIKLHCSVLAEDSIKQAIEDFEQKQ